jgi:murein DD-endopeptidase MepM/ murein hydrolase activator NlpD
MRRSILASLALSIPALAACEINVQPRPDPVAETPAAPAPSPVADAPAPAPVGAAPDGTPTPSPVVEIPMGTSAPSPVAPSPAAEVPGAPPGHGAVADARPADAADAGVAPKAGDRAMGSLGETEARRAEAEAKAQSKDPAKGTTGEHVIAVKGPITQGGLALVDVDGDVKSVRFPGHRVQVAKDGTFFVAFARNAPKEEKLQITFADGTTAEHLFTVAARTFETDRVDGVPEDQVKLDAATRRELASEDARIDAVRRKISDSDCATQGFTWPARGRITSRYGQPRVFNGKEGGIHWGVDIAVPAGTPITAPACGTVAFVDADVPLAGGTLVLDHGRGVTSTFLHLSGFTRQVGDVVKKGDVIARSGATGRTTGAHLDWRMNFLEVRIDPELLVSPQPGTM